MGNRLDITPHGGGLRRLLDRWPAMAMVRKTGSTSVVQAAGAGLTFAMHAVVSWKFGAEKYGMLAHALAVAGVLVMLTPLGWNTAIVRYVAQYEAAGKWALLRGVWRACNRWTIGVSCGAAAIAVGMTYLPFIKKPLALSILTAAALLPLMASLEVRRRAMQGLSKFGQSFVAEQGVLPLLVIAGAFVFPWDITRIGPLLGFFLFCTLIATFTGDLQLKAAMPPAVHQHPPEYRTREWMVTALPMLGSSVGYLVLNRLDVVLLGLVAQMADVGAYSAARRIVVLGTFVLASLNVVLAPALVAAHQAGDTATFHHLVRRTRTLSIIAGVPVFAFLLALPGVPLSMFGIDDSTARAVVRILSLGQLVNVITGPVGTAMAMASRERAQAMISGLTAILATAAMPFAATRFGIVGAAVVTAGSVAFQNILMTIALHTGSPAGTRRIPAGQED